MMLHLVGLGLDSRLVFMDLCVSGLEVVILHDQIPQMAFPIYHLSELDLLFVDCHLVKNFIADILLPLLDYFPCGLLIGHVLDVIDLFLRDILVFNPSILILSYIDSIDNLSTIFLSDVYSLRFMLVTDFVVSLVLEGYFFINLVTTLHVEMCFLLRNSFLLLDLHVVELT